MTEEAPQGLGHAQGSRLSFAERRQRTLPGVRAAGRGAAPTKTAHIPLSEQGREAVMRHFAEKREQLAKQKADLYLKLEALAAQEREAQEAQESQESEARSKAVLVPARKKTMLTTVGAHHEKPLLDPYAFYFPSVSAPGAAPPAEVASLRPRAITALRFDWFTLSKVRDVLRAHMREDSTFTFVEFINAMTALGLHDQDKCVVVYQMMHPDLLGVVTLEVLEEQLYYWMNREKGPLVRYIFDVFDTDQSHQLGRFDITATRNADSGQRLRLADQSRLLLEYFPLLDTDGDGNVSFGDFCKGLGRFPQMVVVFFPTMMEKLAAIGKYELQESPVEREEEELVLLKSSTLSRLAVMGGDSAKPASRVTPTSVPALLDSRPRSRPTSATRARPRSGQSVRVIG